MTLSNTTYYCYWGKANKVSEGGDEYHLLPYHSLDVAAVGSVLLSPASALVQDAAEFLQEDPRLLSRLLTFFLTLHDLGKFTAAFQSLFLDSKECLVRAEKSGLNAYDSRSFRHDRLGLYYWNLLGEKISEKVGIRQEALEVLVQCAFGHHGKPVIRDSQRHFVRFQEPQNELAVEQFTDDVIAMFDLNCSQPLFTKSDSLSKLEQVSWHLAGAFVLCDWLGSDTSYFPYRADVLEGGLEAYWLEAQQKAESAVGASGLRPGSQVRPFYSFERSFDFSPTPLQSWATDVEINNEPQLFLLEDITGSGKTEAALVLVHRLMHAGLADGFYFGLPTMATSNAMFSRLMRWYPDLFESGKTLPSMVLAHGAREMSDEFQQLISAGKQLDNDYASEDQTATGQCALWLSDSRKKALLAPLGVGTIDQALLATLPRRHQSLRLLGLHRKVLIVDEVHAADEYMLELLVSLLQAHRRRGGSAILLSATLPNIYRQKLISTFRATEQVEPLEESFPLATRVNSMRVDATPVAAAGEKNVDVSFIHNIEACEALITDALNTGKNVAWIRNSVDDATEAYQRLQAVVGQRADVTLFHSRFVLADRQAIESKILDSLGKFSAEEGRNRAGKVVVATQVLQESLDIDLDVLISDLCPIDGLIQRMGRLHRHKRDANGQLTTGADMRGMPTLYVHAPEWTSEPDEDWLKKNFRNTEYVYRYPGRLWLGMKMLVKRGRINLPADARPLIEGVYARKAADQVPTALQSADGMAYGQDLTKTAIANSRLIDWRYSYGGSADAWYEDETEIGTRFVDVETRQVILLKKIEGELAPWVDAVRQAVRLSTVTLPINRVRQLAKIPTDLETSVEKFREKYRVNDYMSLWVPELDTAFAYSHKIGFYRIEKGGEAL